MVGCAVVLVLLFNSIKYTRGYVFFPIIIKNKNGCAVMERTKVLLIEDEKIEIILIESASGVD